MILIVDMNGKKDSLSFDEFVLPVVKLLDKPYTITHYSEIKGVDEYSHVILCGTPVQYNQFVEDIQLFTWMKTYNLPLLGICAGMQALGLIHGSFLIPCREFGMISVRTVAANPLFEGEYNAYSVHGNAINPSPWLEVLAVSHGCIQAIKHKEKTHYGVLFHPEVRTPDIIRRFLAL